MGRGDKGEEERRRGEGVRWEVEREESKGRGEGRRGRTGGGKDIWYQLGTFTLPNACCPKTVTF